MDAWNAVTEALQSGDLKLARDYCLAALRHNPDDAEAIHALGLASAREGDYDAAISLFVQAIRLRPQKPCWRADLGFTYSAAGLWEQAAEAFSQNLTLEADDPISVTGYARSLFECERFEEALEAYRIAERLNPESAAVFRGQGRALAALRRFEESITAFNHCAQLEPHVSSTFEYLANAYFQLLQPDQALACSEQALRLRPESPAALVLAATGYSGVGELEMSISAYRKALKLDPGRTSAHSTYLSILLHDTRQSPSDILREHKLWPSAHRALTTPGASFPNSPDPERRLRVGYLSGEFHHNPNFYFVAPIIANHDQRWFELFLYNNEKNSDQCTEMFKKMTSNWLEVHSYTDEQVAELVRKDQIDILVDASGHFANHGLRVMLLRAAPVQVVYPLYPATTGLAEMDYLITDAWTDPEGLTENHYTEQLYRLPSGYIVYLVPAHAPDVNSLPALRNGHLTFGLFQRPAKTNDRVWDAIARVLLRVPRSHLLIHYATRDFDDPNTRVRRRTMQALLSRGVSPERIEFQGALDLDKHLAAVARADVALDSFPYNGQTTTCECLWMGVPVITVTGNTHVSRVGHSILHRVGLGDWVASSPEEYAEIAANIRLDALAELRAVMRERLASSSLLDGRRVTSEIEQAYRWMWRNWCRRSPFPGAPASGTN